MKGMICIVFQSIQTIAANIFAPIKFSATNTSATCYMRKHPIPGYSPDPGLALSKEIFQGSEQIWMSGLKGKCNTTNY